MFRIKRTSGKTWAKLESEDFITPEFLEAIGKLLVDAIVFEAGKDFAKQGNSPTPRGQAEGMPRSLRFFDSFSYNVLAQRQQVEILSSWPWIDQIIDGRPPYPMTWLTQQEGVRRVPMEQPDGTVLIRSTPASPENAWIHPGFARHTFLRRAYDKSRRKMAKMMLDQAAKVALETPFV